MIQHLVRTHDKPENMRLIQLKLRQVKEEGLADIAILSECFNAEYSTRSFRSNSEIMTFDERGVYRRQELSDEIFYGEVKSDRKAFTYKGETVQMLQESSHSLNMYIIGGSIPEIDPLTNRVYNTCLAFNREGLLIGKHRKVSYTSIRLN